MPFLQDSIAVYCPDQEAVELEKTWCNTIHSQRQFKEYNVINISPDSYQYDYYPKYLVIGLGFEELSIQIFDNVYNLMIVNRSPVSGSYSRVIRDLKSLFSSLKKPELLKHLVLCGIEIGEETLNLFHKCVNLRSIELLNCTILAQHLNLTIFPLLIISSISIDNIESCKSLKLISYKFLGFSETLKFPNSSLKQIW
jgi:hypothetical protein